MFPTRRSSGVGREVDRRTGAPFASWRIGEVKLAQRPGLRPVMPVYQSLEDHHVLVLMIEDDVLEPPVEAVGGTVKHCGMAFGAARAGGHQPAAVHPADPRILHR